MKISTKVQYGLRAVAYLSQNSGPDNVVSIKEMAICEGISADYLEKIVSRLEKAGIVNSKKGSNGGYYLARPAASINIGQIFNILENNKTLIKCIDHKGKLVCPKSSKCLTKNLWQRLQKLQDDFLESITLQDLVDNKVN